MSTPDPNDWNATIIAEFRENEGKVGGPFEGAPMVLVHHIGAKSGTERVAPLMARLDGDQLSGHGSAPALSPVPYRLGRGTVAVAA